MRHLPLLAIAALLISACVVAPSARDRPFYSPPDVVSQSDFAGNRWRLEQILFDGVQHGYDADAQNFMFFSPTGYIDVTSKGECLDRTTLYIDFSDDKHFQITLRTWVAGGCNDDNVQKHRFCVELSSDYDPVECSKVLLTTTEAPAHFIMQTSTYELIGNHLILRGGEGENKVEMWFVMDNP